MRLPRFIPQCSASPASSSSRHGALYMFAPRRRRRPCCLNMAASFRPSLRLMNMRTQCRGSPMWRESSGRGSMPITPPMRSHYLPTRSARSTRTARGRRLHCSSATRIVRSPFAAVTIFAANRGRGGRRSDRCWHAGRCLDRAAGCRRGLYGICPRAAPCSWRT